MTKGATLTQIAQDKRKLRWQKKKQEGSMKRQAVMSIKMAEEERRRKGKARRSVDERNDTDSNIVTQVESTRAKEERGKY